MLSTARFALVVPLCLFAMSPLEGATPKLGISARDPNEKLCQDIVLVGSRIASKRFCATRAEWEAKKRDDKDVVDAIQRSPCVVDESGSCTH